MARNGNNTAAAAKQNEPDDLYDKLGSTGQHLWDQIGSYGFRPDRDEKGNWFGLAISGDTKLGPFDSLKVLLGEAQRHAEASNGKRDSDEVEFTEDHKGPRLPGIPLVADKQIVTAAGKFKAINTEWKDKGKERTEALNDLKAICHAKPHLFKKDPENSNAKIYRAGSMLVRLKDTHKEKVEVEIDEDDDE